MINIVIPMAGAGSRFAKEGYQQPKPFIDIEGRMMIEHVLDGLQYDDAQYTLIIQERFLLENKESLEKIQRNYNVQWVYVKGLTAGATCSALASYKWINNDRPVVFADSDNIFNAGVVQAFIDDAFLRQLDGSLLTFQTNEACFSFAKINERQRVVATAEKKPISTHAIAGVYFFKKGVEFVEQAINMMIYNDKQQGEFYLSNVYNWLIKNNQHCQVGIFNIASSDWHCVGTPQQLERYLNSNRG